ncbi:FAD-dependent oxidoreductase [Glycomyces sp. NRRL B-16210]|uniref:FAD-dependent oxidoreductase n=1 Tax=Glycomyces sp. NRRL B-16210 TaxID=1463821 RepID=UPI0004C284A5|nr:FAD-dependent oxidoreductase [Glycomyces sp. NRRL B-16210]
MRIIVIGGGVAGAASALALRRIGAEVAVYEAYPDPAGDVGSFVSLAANGLRGLELLGCLPAVQEAGLRVPRLRMWSAGGHLLGDVARGRRSEDPLHSVTLLRGSLVETLRAAAVAAGAELRLGERMTGATPTERGARVEFASGRTDSADLVVAADGIWSSLRGAVDPAAGRPEYAGLYTVSGVSHGIEVEPGTFNLTFARRGAFFHLAAENGEVWWGAQIDEPVAPERDGVEDAAWLRRVAEAYRREAEPSRVIAATARLHHPVLMHVLEPVRTWHRGRIVLTGDAAHPVGAGQGASMAIEDAIALAEALRTAATPKAALETYAAQRNPRIAKVLETAEDNRDAKRAGPVARRAKAVMMRLFIPLMYEKASGWLYDYRPELGASDAQVH